MRVEDVFANAPGLLGRQITVEGFMQTDYHSCAYLVPSTHANHPLCDSIQVTTDCASDQPHQLPWHRSPVGAALNTIEDYFAMSPAFRKRHVSYRLFITGTLLHADDARFTYTLERVTQIFAYAEEFGCTLVYKPENGFDKVGFHELPAVEFNQMWCDIDAYIGQQIRLNGMVACDGDISYLIAPAHIMQRQTDQIAVLQLGDDDSSGEFPTYEAAAQHLTQMNGVELRYTGLTGSILADTTPSTQAAQVIGTLTPHATYPFRASLVDLRTIAIPQDNHVIAIWDLKKYPYGEQR